MKGSKKDGKFSNFISQHAQLDPLRAASAKAEMVNKPTKQPKKVLRDSRSPSPEFDPQAFQASLDESVNAARELVNSWIPQDFGGGSNSANGFGGPSGSSSVQSLKDKARPPR